MHLRAEYDRRADALYVYVSEKPVAASHELSRDLIVDHDADDQLCGIELLTPRKVDLSPLLERYQVDSDDLRATIERALGVRA